MSIDKKKFYITTAIDYPSQPGHLGHALEKVQADVLARYKRQIGFKVHFSTGTDEHGLKLQRYAKKANKEPQEFVDEMSGHFKKLCKVLNISNDDFVRTTEKRHEKVVQEIIKKVYEKKDIYKGKYKGLYCVECESFYLPKDLENGKCPVHHKELEMIEEETYFFKMSKYQDQLVNHIHKNKEFIIPESKKREILNRLKGPLQDLSVSRVTVEWGIPFPYDKNLTIFVWLEALMNYLTTVDYPNKKFKIFWPVDVHIIGKDIIWHHAVIWSSLLLSLGLPLPKSIFTHGFITVNGQKMSKSSGDIVDPIKLIEKYGVDVVRYYLLREISSTEDGDFSIKRLEERYNADLANGLGNLVSRVLALSSKAKKINKKPVDEELSKQTSQVHRKYKKAMEEIKFKEALEAVWQFISLSDEYVEKNKPWELIKKDQDKFDEVLSCLLLRIKVIAEYLRPFLPETAEKIIKQVKANKKTENLFPRLDK